MEDGATKARKEKERLIKLEQERIAALTGETDTTNEVETEGTPEVAPEVETPVVEVPPDLQQKYDALLAKYNSEVPRLHSWNREKDEKIATLTNEITNLQRQIIELQTASVPETDDEGKPLYRSPHVTDEIRKSDTYQYYLAEFGQTYAERQAEMSILAAQNTVKPVEERMNSNEAETAEERFHRELHELCPDWIDVKRGINVDPAFVGWLNETFALKAFQEAAYEGDIHSMANIINRFKSTIKLPEPPVKREIPAHLAAPAKTGGGAQTIIENNKGNVMKMTDLEALYNDFSRGLYRGKEQEYEAKKREFLQAKAEGRLV